MRTPLADAFEAEMRLATTVYARGDVHGAFAHLERAHVLGQRRVWRHVRSHLAMLRLGLADGDWREVAGQLPRIVAALLFSRVWVPIGNTGRARVSALTPMPVAPDLAALLDQDGRAP